MFRKPKRNFRKKVADSDSDHEKEEDTNDAAAENVSVKPPVPTVVPEKKTKSKKKSEDKAAKATILSFEDEDGEETEVFKVKKSSHSKRIAKQLKKESQKEKEIKTDSPLTIEGDNSADQLKELRHKQRSNPMGNGKVINIPDEDGESDESEEESGAHAFRAILQRGEIPDANTIHMIRKKRQMAREMGDFIPVEDVNENSGSRLIRDDENDRSDDEEDGRIDFSVNNFAKERQKMKDEFLAAEHGSDEESDQERQWEEQQIRKGVSTQQVGGPPDSYTSSGLGMPPSDFYNSEYTSSLAPATAYAPAQSAFPAPTPVTGGQNQEITIDIITKRLRERVESMTGIHRSHLQEKEQLVQDVEDTERSIDGAEDRSNALEERYRFFQEMRGYVRDLVECLNEKVPQINELERQMVELLRERSGRLVARRQQDVQDQCQDYMANKNATVLKQTEADAARQRRTAEREARKSRRRRAREGKNIRGHHDGLSSDDEESKSDFSKFKHTKERVVSQHQLVFEDVVDDFCQIDAIRDRFDQWRRKQGDSYKEAYISLCLPKLFTPLLRLQLVLWNPLEENCPDFEESPWFSDLLFYGFEEDVILHRVDDDDDIKLLPSIVDKVLAPKITALVESVWDPMSTSQTSRLVNLLQRLTSDYPPINAQAKNTQTLLKAIVTRIRKTLDDDVFMPLYPKSVIENKSSGPAVFFQRQFWACIKLLGNILSWHGILAPPILQHMALDSLLNRYIILGLQNSGLNTSTLDKLQAIVSTFPRDWFSDLEGEKTLPQLENICRYLNYAANTLYQSSLNKRELDQKEAREMIKQISKMLVNIRAIDHAKNMAEKYSFKLT